MFDKFIELFKVGKHTDSQGNSKEWTEKDCQEIANNHNSASIRAGHDDANIYGNIKKVRFENGILSALFENVDKTFQKIVESGEIVNRSIGLKKTNGSWGIDHVAFLGKSQPAIPDLAPIFSKGDGECHAYTFSFNVADLEINPYAYQSGIRSIAMLFRKMRDFIIDQYDIDTADKIITSWEVDNIDSAETAIKPEDKLNDDHFSTEASASKKGDTMPDKNPQPATFSQAEVDAAIDKAKAELQKNLDKAYFEKRQLEFETTVKQAISDGNITPAQAEGMPEFMARLDAKTEFNFSKNDKDTKTKASAWFESFVGSLKEGVKVGQEMETDEPKADFSAQDIREYATKHNVDAATACAQLKLNKEK